MELQRKHLTAAGQQHVRCRNRLTSEHKRHAAHVRLASLDGVTVEFQRQTAHISRRNNRVAVHA